ncbi:hypothetical protein [uncultured Bradyrhizobium sp.]|uniref:hypothetical protein n=1 Tax=uncultured Bradyrhizobium sp. TaxID=199684 RepID=UPI0026209B93|nr:hypothetical protein [uncultured Bradyrhizobium sp.]
MQAFFVSICAGVFFPLVPFFLEFILDDRLKPETIAVTAVVYVTAIGLVSRHQAILISGFLVTVICAVIYAGVEAGLLKTPEDHANLTKYGVQITVGAIVIYSICYAVERFGRHCVDGEPFLEL